ncbi:MAG TPA: hypothetical protein GX711_02165, partial [Clostridia bacterium]|nr:hypothetical protein [Clostridia bacterium]
LAREAGLNILLQVQSWPQASPEKVGELFSHLRQEEGLAALLFNDGILPGYPDSLPVLVESVRQLDVPVGIIEFFPQAGLESLVQSLGKRAVRLHAISDKEMAGKMTPGRGVERFTLAAAERNNRILLARFFFKPEIGDLLTYNLDYMGSLGSALRNQGFTFGPAVPYGSFPVSRLLLFLMGLGVIAGGVFLCNWLMPARWALTLGVLGVLGWLVILAIGRVDGGRLLMAMGAVMIYPTLSVASGLRKEGVGPGRSIYLLVRTSLFSLIGAVLLVGLLADVGFMLKIEQFRGVKAAHVLPLILLVIILLVREEGKNWLKNVVEWFQARISVGWALLASVLALALVVYVMRTGNEAAVVSGLELEIRSWLDRILLVRPRTKEFLIGHPLLVLSFYLGYRHRYLPLALLGAIGQVSLVNTFAHVHTPLGVSFFRAFNGLWLGLLLGAALIMVYRLVVAWGKKVFHGE